MSQNGQIHFKNFTANAARFSKCVWPFWDIMHKRVKWINTPYPDSKTLANFVELTGLSSL